MGVNVWSAARAGILLSGLGVVLVGCGSDGSDAAKTIPASEVCHGHISSEGAASAEFLTGTKKFSPTGNHMSEVSLKKAAAALSDGYMGAGGGDPVPKRACEITTLKGPSSGLSIRFVTTTDGALDGPVADTLKKYDVGRGAFVGVPRGYLYFDCVSPKFYGSTQEKPVVVQGDISNNLDGQGRYKQKGGPEKIREANLTVLHSLSLSMAKELRCADNGGLKAKLTLKPAGQNAEK